LCFLCIVACFFACGVALLPIEPALESAAGAAEVGADALVAGADGMLLGSDDVSAANAGAVRSAATRLLMTTLFILFSFSLCDVFLFLPLHLKKVMLREC
jgi:hypothetical protein